MSEPERVQKVIANAGLCSRRNAELLIEQGKVTVNGTVAKLGDTATEQDEILVEGKPLSKEQPVYLLFHKPVGCVTAVTDAHEKTVMDYVRIRERVYPVGRLDKETSGLLILTNDGDLAQRIAHPSFETKKTYVAELNTTIRLSELKKLERGLELEDGKTSPCTATLLSPMVVELVIHEGKNRIVRRMFEHLGYTVVALRRTKIGALTIGDLPLGRYRLVSKNLIEKALHD